MSMFPATIFNYIKQSESSFDSEQIRIGDNWSWSLRDHVQLIFHLKNGVFYSGENDWLRSFRQVMEPVIELANWTEDLEVKDVVFFIEGDANRVKSFLIKKYHDEVYSREHNLDELFDEITEHDNTYGGVLVDMAHKKMRPKAIPLTKLAFCDQTDMLASPVGVKMYFSPSGLRKMEKNGWGKESNGAQGSISDLIALADFSKQPEGARRGTKANDTPGKNIEVYIVRGEMPESYLNEKGDDEETVNQLQIVAFYYDKGRNRQGFILYRKKEKEGTLRFFTSKEVEGRALGRGVGEQMLHPQIWSNFLETHKTEALRDGVKSPLVTDDQSFANRNEIEEMENNEVATIAEGKTIFRINTMDVSSVQMLNDSIDRWFQHAQYVGSAFDPLLGKEQASGTTFRGQERVVAQGKGPHDRKRGKRAKFIEALYREVLIPQMVNEIVDGKEFLATLTADEVQWLLDTLAENYANQQILNDLWNKKLPRDKEQLRNEFTILFRKRGNKFLLKILKDEFSGVETKIGINIAGKQKDLRGLSDKLLSVFQFIFANPQAFQQSMQVPGMAKAFSDILEYSNIDQTEFMSMVQEFPAQQPQGATPPSSQQIQQSPTLQQSPALLNQQAAAQPSV